MSRNKKPKGVMASALSEAFNNAGISLRSKKSKSHHNKQNRKRKYRPRATLQDKEIKSDGKWSLDNAPGWVIRGLRGNRELYESLVKSKNVEIEIIDGRFHIHRNESVKTEHPPQPQIAVPPKKVKPKTEVRINGTPEVNEQLRVKSAKFHYDSKIYESLGEMAVDGSDEQEFIIGMDFGTSFTKVAIRHANTERAWAIPFTTNIDNRYIVSSSAYKTKDKYSLMHRGQEFNNLKTPLILGQSTKEERIRSAIFLSMIIHHSKKWFMNETKDIFPDVFPIWYLHIGLPAKSLNNKDLVLNYRVIAMSAMVIADFFEMTVSEADAEQIYRLIEEWYTNTDVEDSVNLGGEEYYKDQLEVIPEIAAQVFGYVKSESWDEKNPKIMLVDIGGGTLDASIFNVTVENKSEHNFHFLRSCVEPLGAFNLHMRRLQHLIHLFQNREGFDVVNRDVNLLIESNTQPDAIPQTIEEYVGDIEYSNLYFDLDFFSKVHSVLWKILIDVKKNRDPMSDQWRSLPLIVCGGGSNLKKYFLFRDHISKSNTSIGFKTTEIPVPKRLYAKGLKANEYPRLSVAYGLSFDNVGAFESEDEIPDIALDEPRGFGGGYIGPEQM